MSEAEKHIITLAEGEATLTFPRDLSSESGVCLAHFIAAIAQTLNKQALEKRAKEKTDAAG